MNARDVAAVPGGARAARAPDTGLVSFANNAEFDDPLSRAREHSVRLQRMRRGVIASAKAIEEDLAEDGYFPWDSSSGRWRPVSDRDASYRCALLTFTYAAESQWEPAHIRTVLDHYRKWAKRNGCRFSYVWTMELHKSGRPHYHAVIWVTGGHTPPFPDAQGWWPHGMSQAKWAVSPVGYIAKYASKGTSADLPRGARLWGAGGMSTAAVAKRTWACAPKWLRTLTPPGTRCRRGKIERPYAVYRGEVVRERLSGWLTDMGLFIGPWVVDRLNCLGVVLAHRGYAEFATAEGDYFRIPMAFQG